MKTNTKAIISIAYPEVEKKLKNSNTSTKYKNFMSKFVQQRQKELYSTMPSKQLYYSTDDVDEWFKSTGINKEIIIKAIKDTYYYSIANFNPNYAKDESTVALLCMVRYYYLSKKKKELDLALINIAFSGKFYPSIFYKSFRFEPAEYVMDYVVNHMLNNKYVLIKYGTVISAVKAITETWIETYDDRFRSFSDEDCIYLIQQLHNRIDSFIHNIATLYYEAYKNKEAITYDADNLSDDDYHVAENDSYKIASITERALKEITTRGVDYVNCKRASNDIVKFDELKNIIDSIINNKENILLIKEYITILVSLYFQDNNLKNINDLSFITYSIKPTPNSKNKYILRKKELIDIILINNSENFQRRRSRAATESAYYRALNAYIALMIQKANK